MADQSVQATSAPIPAVNDEVLLLKMQLLKATKSNDEKPSSSKNFHFILVVLGPVSFCFNPDIIPFCCSQAAFR